MILLHDLGFLSIIYKSDDPTFIMTIKTDPVSVTVQLMITRVAGVHFKM